MAYDERGRRVEEENHLGIGSIVKAGALVGAGALGWRYRRQIGRGLGAAADFSAGYAARGISSLGKAAGVSERLSTMSTAIRAMHHADDGKSILHHMRNPGRFQQRFDEFSIRDIEARVRQSKTPLGGMATEIEDQLFDLRKSFRRGEEAHIRSLRYQKVVDRMKAEMPDKWENQLQHILPTVRNKDFFDDPSEAKVQGFMEKYSAANAKKEGFSTALTFANEIERKKFATAFHSALSDYADTSLISKSEIRNGVNGTYGTKGVRRDQLEGFKRDNSKEAKATWLSKVLERHGMRQATVRELLEAGSGRGGLFDSDSRSIRRNGGRQDARMGSKLQTLGNYDNEILDLIADRNVFIDKYGQIKDYRRAAKNIDGFLTGMKENTQIPFLGFNPLDLAHWSTLKAVEGAPKNYLLRRGTIDPHLASSARTVAHPMSHNQDAAVGALSRDYMYTGGRVVDIVSGEVIENNMYLTSARFGMFPRMNASMANLHTQDYTKAPLWKRITGLGMQETESIWSRTKSVLTKFDDPEWGRNIISAMAKGEAAGGLSAESGFKLIYSQLNQKSNPLSNTTVDYINQFAKQAYGDINVDLRNLNTPDDILDTLHRLSNAMGDRGSAAYRSQELHSAITNMWQQQQRNPSDFLTNVRIKPDNKPILPGSLSALDASDTQLVGKLEDTKRLIHQHAIQQIDHHFRSASLTTADLVREGIKSDVLGKEALGEIRDLANFTHMRQWWDDIYIKGGQHREEALTEFSDAVLDPDNGGFRASLQKSMNQMNPNWAAGPGQEPPNHFGFVGYQTMRKGKDHRWWLENYNQQIAQGEGKLSAGWSSTKGVLQQLTAGRKNLDDVTTFTAPMYYAMERMNNALGHIGLALPQKDLGSAQSIFFNMMGKRVLLPYVAYKQAQYVDGLFGDVFSDQLGETYANMHEDVGHIKEAIGINRLGREASRVFAGADQIAGWPIFAALKHGTFGLLGDNRSGEDIRSYYESGEDPIRRGRWWGIGSSTPWMGGKIDRYEPNWYRKMKSDWAFTDTLYGSEQEYWKNHWMPTLTNPLAPLRHFVTDSNWLEKKHMEDRPYPITGGFGELDMVPIIGPTLNNTVGRVLKPRMEHPDLRKAHREYLEEVNASIAAQYDAGNAGAMMEYMPAGGFNLIDPGAAGTSMGSISFGGSEEGDLDVSYAIGEGSGASGGSGTSRAQLAALNLGLTAKSGSFGSMTSLESLRDPDFVADLKDVGTMHSVSGSIRDTFYSMSEVAGMYGFLTKTGIGFNESGRGWVLDPSSRMTSMSRAWWDLDMGGLGGNASEIGRRFLPRDPNKNYYNPIKNTMPDWLPGVDYFTDFQHGDPYVKIKRGEIRLPGKAYESINKLHPDAFGEYGAFDRFKILADVAPYSKEYKEYRRVVSKMNQEGMLTDDMKKEYAEIRDQVAARKSKYQFYNRRFGNADVNRESVTVTQVLDANTFITKEYGEANPIKLAGVSVKSDDQQSQDFVKQFIYAGAKLDIELDADPLHRVRDDMMNTMRAVVYTQKNEEGMPWFLANKGANLNYMLANRKWDAALGMFGGHSNVSVKDDGSATATRALFAKSEITVGKIWEGVVHDILPSLPIMGPIFDKFLQVRSPLEQYKRSEIYGKAWRPWQEPIKSWLMPMIDTIASRNPIIGAAQGYGIGWLAGKGLGKHWGGRYGAVIGGAVSTLRVFNEAVSGAINPNGKETWVPKRRQTEREINEYFDKLTYIKYKGLYEKARWEAINKEGVDVEELLGDSGERGKQNKYNRRLLESTKKYLAISKKLGYGDQEVTKQQLDRVREELKGIDSDRPVGQIGSATLLALRYRAEFESTLYGADPNGDMTKIFKALPSKDREFFTEFMKASPKEREEILRLVPKDQRRFYQAKWGMEVEGKGSLEGYFSKHYLPDENWEGWRTDVSLDSIKVKVVKNEGLELTDFGLWQDDEQRAEKSGVKPVEINSVGHLIEPSRLEKVLRGAGLQDVSVQMTRMHGKEESKIDLAFDVMKDRSNEIVSELNSNMGSIFA